MTRPWMGETPDPERDRLEAELARAEADQVAYRFALELVRPYMQGTDRTLEEAIEALRATGINPTWLLPLTGARA